MLKDIEYAGPGKFEAVHIRRMIPEKDSFVASNMKHEWAARCVGFISNF